MTLRSTQLNGIKEKDWRDYRRLFATAQHNRALKGDRNCLLQHHLFPMIRSSCYPFGLPSLQCDALLWIFRIGVWTWPRLRPRPRPVTQMLLLIRWDFLSSLSQDIVLHLFPIFSISSSVFLFFSLSSSVFLFFFFHFAEPYLLWRVCWHLKVKNLSEVKFCQRYQSQTDSGLWFHKCSQ